MYPTCLMRWSKRRGVLRNEPAHRVVTGTDTGIGKTAFFGWPCKSIEPFRSDPRFLAVRRTGTITATLSKRQRHTNSGIRPPLDIVCVTAPDLALEASGQKNSTGSPACVQYAAQTLYGTDQSSAALQLSSIGHGASGRSWDPRQ